MRIAVIGTRGMAGPARDGIEQALRELCPRLAGRGHRIDIFSERNGHALPVVDGARRITLPRLPVVLGEASPHAVLSSLISACRAYDVVNFFAAEAGGLFTLASRLGLHRTVVSVHGFEREPLAAKGPGALAARYADAITVSSRRLERLFRETYGRDAVYIPNGIEPRTREADPAMLAQWGLRPDTYILFADRLVSETGAHLAIAAANALPSGLPLVIAGTGDCEPSYAARLHAAARPGKVIFVGSVARPLLDALMGHAYLYVLPSQADEAPETLLASLAHGRAAVVSDVAEHLEVMAGDGFTFTAGDVGDLKRVLAWLQADPEVVGRMRLRAARSVMERFCWDRIADAYEHVYKAIL